MFTYDLSIFLTSTAFVDTKAKYGIPFSRYAVFLKNVLRSMTLFQGDFRLLFDKEKQDEKKDKIVKALAVSRIR